MATTQGDVERFNVNVVKPLDELTIKAQRGLVVLAAGCASRKNGNQADRENLREAADFLSQANSLVCMAAARLEFVAREIVKE